MSAFFRSGHSMVAHMPGCILLDRRPSTSFSPKEIRNVCLHRSMSWRRLPTYLANLRLRLMPFNEQQRKAYEETGHVQQIAFKTTPRVGKVCGIP